jgi:NADH:ubiquinone oxidoreductase subunit 4 (subunit M)
VRSARLAAVLQGAAYPLLVSSSAVVGVVLGALYMLWFAQRFLFGEAEGAAPPAHRSEHAREGRSSRRS